MSATEAVLLCGCKKSSDTGAVMPWDMCGSCNPETVLKPVGLTVLKPEHYTPYTDDYVTKDNIDGLRKYCLYPQSNFSKVFNHLYPPGALRPPYSNLQFNDSDPKKQLLEALCEDLRGGVWVGGFRDLFKKYRFDENWFLSMIVYQIYTNYKRGRDKQLDSSDSFSFV